MNNPMNKRPMRTRIDLTQSELALVRKAFREAFVRFPNYKTLAVIEEALKVLPVERRPRLRRGLVKIFRDLKR